MWFKDGPSPGEERLTYEGYLRVEELLQLQRPESKPEEHDELQFIIVHQVYELWFRLILHTLDEVGRRMDADDPREATRLLGRVVEIQRVLVSQLRVMETMLPTDFLRFRDRLKPASGFQSAQFRELEATIAWKDTAMLRFFPEGTPARARLDRRHAAPTLADRLWGLLGRASLESVKGVPASREDRLRALVEVYRTRERRRDLVTLCEALVDMDEALVVWRFHHVRMAERVIGRKQGTGGSDGVDYLERSLRERGKAFPELWEVRSML